MCDWLMDGIPRNIAENPDIGVVWRIRDSLRDDTGQTCESGMLLPCPFCGCERPFVQTSPLGECTEEARVVCPSCHVATTREFQSWRVYCGEDDLTRTLAIGRAISLWNRRAERTCKRRNHDTDNYYMRCCSCSRCNAGWFEDTYDKPFSYCPHCGAKVVDE